MAEALPDSDSDFSDKELSDFDQEFFDACQHVSRITSKLKDDQLLQLYGLYKQSTEGKCNTSKPGWLDAKGRKKWEAWKGVGDISKDDAKSKYISLVQNFDPDCKIKQRGQQETWVKVSSLQHNPEPKLIVDEMTLFDAAREDLGKLVTKLLSKNPELRNKRDENGLTALHWAADRDSTDALTAALEGGCNVNAVDDTNQTALHYAASCGHKKSIDILLRAGALLIRDEEGCTPADVATDSEIKNMLNPPN